MKLDHNPLLDTYELIPVRVSRGEGVLVWDEDGREYLDLYGGHAVALLGHSPKVIRDAIQAQAEKLFFYSNLVPLTVRDTAARKMAEIIPEGLRNIFFCNSGAEANENALKLAIQWTGREKLVSFKGGFHGRTLLALATTDSPAMHAELKGWTGGRVTFLSPNDEGELHHITPETAAVILEPIQSIGGVVSFSVKYLQKLRERCSETGTLLIFDEVQTGFGRTGLPFVSGYGGVSPDMFTTAKGIGSGYPLGALCIADYFARKIKIGDLGSTYGAGPIAMAVVHATVTALQEHHLIEHVRALSAEWETLREVPNVQEIRGQGCLIGIKTTHRAKDLIPLLLSKGIIAGTSKDPNVLRLLPPLILEPSHIAKLKRSLSEVLL